MEEQREVTSVRVTYMCGHKKDEDWYGDQVEDRLAMVQESILCRHCLEDQQGVPQGVLSRLIELPDLSGSSSQVEWARKIRLSFVRQAIKELTRSPMVTDGLDDFLALLKNSANGKMLRGIFSVETAKWWIDNRDDVITAPLPNERHY